MSSTPELPDLERTKVTLPWAAFQALLPEPEAPRTPALPQAHAIPRADYRVEVLADHAKVTGEVEVVVLDPEPWITVPVLRRDEVALVSATLDGDPAHLANSGDAASSLTLRGAGARTLRVEFLVALTGSDPSARALEFTCVRAPATRLTVRGIPADTLVSCKPGFGLDERVEDGVRVAEGALPPTTSIQLSWRPEAERLETQRTPLVSADLTSSIQVEERSLHVTATCELEVRGAPTSEVELELPDDFQLHAAQGELVRDARPREGKLVVRLAHDLLGKTTVRLRGEIPLPPEGGVVAAPVFALPAGLRQRGAVEVHADPRVEVEVVQLQGAVRIDPSEVGRGEGLLAFKFVRERPQIQLGLKRHKDASVLVATCDHAHYRALVLPDGKTLVQGHLLIRNNARPHLVLGLPEGAELWSSYAGGRPVRPSAGSEGQALVPLLRQPDDAFEVELTCFVRSAPLGDRGHPVLELPGLDLPSTYTSLALFLPSAYRHFNFEGTLRRVDTFTRAFSPPQVASATAIPLTNMVQAQALAPPPPPKRGGFGAEGQLPIRFPMLERGDAQRFEATLLIGDRPRVAWELKRRRPRHL